MSRRSWYLLMNSLIGLWLLATAVVVLARELLPFSGWLMVHLLLLGAVSTAILIWSQHFADALLRRGPPGGRVLHGVRLLGHSLGAAAVVTGVAAGWWPLILAGGIAVAAVAVLHAVVLVRQLRGGLPARFSPLVRYYIAAGGFLVLGVTMGAWMALGHAQALHERIYWAHLSFTLLGWVGLTVIGTVLLLWPTVLRVRVAEGVDRTAVRALLMLIAALLVMGAGILLDLQPLTGAGALVYLIALGMVLVDAWRQLRASKQHDIAVWSLAAALLWFTASLVAVCVIAAVAESWADAAAALSTLLLPLAVGFAAQIVLGALSYLIPVVLGGGPLRARRAAAVLDRAGGVRAVVLNTGLLLLLTPLPEVVGRAVAVMVFAALLAFPVLMVAAVLLAERVTDAAAGPDAAGSAAAGAAAAMKPAAAASRPLSTIALGIAAVLLVVVAAFGFDPSTLGGAPPPPPPAPIEPTGQVTTVEVSMRNMRYFPETIEVPAGDELVIILSNDDHHVHDLVIQGAAASELLHPGDTVRLEVGLITEGRDGWCSVPGHRQQGMVMRIEALVPFEAPAVD